MVLELARVLSLDDQETRQLLEASFTALTPHWSVPYPRNPYFTGREDVLEALHAQLGIGQAVALSQSSALHGLGGVGKTQIALEYAYRSREKYQVILWAKADSPEVLTSELASFATLLKVPGQQEQDRHYALAAVKRWLEVHPNWLLILDNIADLKVAYENLPSAPGS